MENNNEHKYLVLVDGAIRVYWTTSLALTSASDIVFDVVAMRERSYDTGRKWKVIRRLGAKRDAHQADEAEASPSGLDSDKQGES